MDFQDDSKDHTFIIKKAKEGYKLHSMCEYMKLETAQALKTKVFQNHKMLNDIDIAIRSHYFREGCKHENNIQCRAFILDEIIKITGYQPRTELVPSKQQKVGSVK